VGHEGARLAQGQPSGGGVGEHPGLWIGHGRRGSRGRDRRGAGSPFSVCASCTYTRRTAEDTTAA